MEEYSGTISVQGKGSIHVVPDITRLEVLVESVFIDYDAAYKQAKDNAQWIVNAIVKLDVLAHGRGFSHAS